MFTKSDLHRAVEFAADETTSAGDNLLIERLVGGIHAALPVEQRAALRKVLTDWETAYGTDYPSGVR